MSKGPYFQTAKGRVAILRRVTKEAKIPTLDFRPVSCVENRGLLKRGKTELVWNQEVSLEDDQCAKLAPTLVYLRPKVVSITFSFILWLALFCQSRGTTKTPI